MSANRLRGRPRSRAVICAETLVGVAERLGPTFIKFGQFLSTRRDVFGDEAIGTLARLQDRTAPMPSSEVAAIFQDEFGIRLEDAFSSFDTTPIGSGSIATVYRARLRDGPLAAVKIRRPGVSDRIRDDVALLRSLCRLIEWLPGMDAVPMVQMFDTLSGCLARQIDFALEARSNSRIRSSLASIPGVVVPSLVDPLCGDSVITMEYISATRADGHLPANRARDALITGLRALFHMIFVEGFVHCDMHDGNLQFLDDGRPVLLDFGFMAELGDRERRRFAEFFYAVAINDSTRAAEIILEVAAFVPPSLSHPRFERDVRDVVGGASGAQAREFQVARFVAQIFDLQRRHGIVGSAGFTMAIVSLLVFEGIAKHVDPDLDFQREAIPFVVNALTATRLRGTEEWSAAADGGLPERQPGNREEIKEAV
jgi:ubiquinone biosynthesis protein